MRFRCPEGVAALREQLDLTEVELNPGLVLFEVERPWPLRSDITELELPEDAATEALLRMRWRRPPRCSAPEPARGSPGS